MQQETSVWVPRIHKLASKPHDKHEQLNYFVWELAISNSVGVFGAKLTEYGVGQKSWSFSHGNPILSM